MVGLLTLLTQIGGLVWLLSIWIGWRWALGRSVRLLVFLGLYAGTTIAANLTAPVFGREPSESDPESSGDDDASGGARARPARAAE